MSPLDVVSAGLDGAGTVIDRVDVQRVTDLVGDLAAVDLAAAVATAADRASDQAANIAEFGQQTSRNTRIAVIAGAVVLVVGLVFFVKRRKSSKRSDARSADAPTLSDE